MSKSTLSTVFIFSLFLATASSTLKASFYGDEVSFKQQRRNSWDKKKKDRKKWVREDYSRDDRTHWKKEWKHYGKGNKTQRRHQADGNFAVAKPKKTLPKQREKIILNKEKINPDSLNPTFKLIPEVMEVYEKTQLLRYVPQGSVLIGNQDLKVFGLSFAHFKFLQLRQEDLIKHKKKTDVYTTDDSISTFFVLFQMVKSMTALAGDNADLQYPPGNVALFFRSEAVKFLKLAQEGWKGEGVYKPGMRGVIDLSKKLQTEDPVTKEDFRLLSLTLAQQIKVKKPTFLVKYGKKVEKVEFSNNMGTDNPFSRLLFSQLDPAGPTLKKRAVLPYQDVSFGYWDPLTLFQVNLGSILQCYSVKEGKGPYSLVYLALNQLLDPFRGELDEEKTYNLSEQVLNILGQEDTRNGTNLVTPPHFVIPELK